MRTANDFLQMSIAERLAEKSHLEQTRGSVAEMELEELTEVLFVQPEAVSVSFGNHAKGEVIKVGANLYTGYVQGYEGGLWHLPFVNVTAEELKQKLTNAYQSQYLSNGIYKRIMSI